MLGILKPELSGALGWSEAEYGSIVMAFQAAYALGLPAADGLMDRLGTRPGYTLSLVVWSVAGMAHALARTATGLGIARFVYS